nr:hypothetical protein F987_03326 [Acinetobacter gyllenbergii NIPH 230]
MRVFSFLNLGFYFFSLSLSLLLKLHNYFCFIYMTDQHNKKFQLVHSPTFTLGFDSSLLLFLWFFTCLKFTGLKIVIR